MIHIYFIYIFKCNLVYIVILMCNDTYVPHTFLLQLLFTYLIYIYRGNSGSREICETFN